MSRPVVSSSLATCCTVLSVFGFIILGALGLAFNANVEVLMGSTDSPHDGHAVAVNCWFASLVYLAFVVFCACQVGVNRRYQRGALEITAAGITVQYWEGAARVNIAVWITVFWLLFILVNVFGTLGYAEEEFWASLFKLAVVIVFIIIGVVLNCGGGDGEYSTYVGGRYWRDPGAFAHGFKGVCSVFVTAAFSFAGTELVSLAATKTPIPCKALPPAVKAGSATPLPPSQARFAGDSAR